MKNVFESWQKVQYTCIYMMKRNSCNNRHDIASRSIDIESHVFLGDTSVPKLQKLKVFKSKTHPGRIIFASIFTDITIWESAKVRAKCISQAEEKANYAARFSLGCCCFCCPGSKKTWTCNEDKPSYQFADGGWDNFALHMVNTQKHQRTLRV